MFVVNDWPSTYEGRMNEDQDQGPLYLKLEVGSHSYKRQNES